MINSKKASRIASMRIREVGKLHNTRIYQPEEDKKRPSSPNFDSNNFKLALLFFRPQYMKS